MKCLSIHLTDLCNSECTFCVVGSPYYKTDSVRYADVERFLIDNAHNGYAVVNLHGGEPTIHPRFLDTLRLIGELGYPEIHLQTNGIRLAKPEFVETLIGARVRKFIISLHGAAAATHDGQTFSPGGFVKTLDGIRHVKRHGVHVRTNTVITNTNLHELPAISELACSLGVDHVNLSAMHPVSSAIISRAVAMPSYAAIHDAVCAAIDVARRFGRRVTLEGFPHCAVFGDGRERLHLHNEYRGIRLMVRGTVQDDYDDWMRDKMRAFGPPCTKCNAREVCGGVYPQYVAYYGWGEFSPVPFGVDALDLHVAHEH